MAPAKLDAFGIVVSDLRRSLAFYRQLGVPFTEGAENSEHGHAEAVLVGGIRLMVDTEAAMRSFDPSWQRGSGAGGAALAFQCDTAAAVDQLFRNAVGAGARPHKEPWDAFWGQRYAQLRDPDGNPIDIYANLATS